MTRRIFLLKAIEENNIECLTETKIKGIEVDCVQCETCLEMVEVKAATVVLALGMESDNTLARELECKVRSEVIDYTLDARAALEGIREGFFAAVQD